jgi:hypothetical protein
MSGRRALAFLFTMLPAGVAAQGVSPPQAPLDTVIRFDLRERTWNWPYLAAHVGLGCQGQEVSIGTTTAPDSAFKNRERLCAGALVEMRNSTLTLRNARGLVHVRVRRSLTRGAGDSIQPRR